MWFNDHPPPHFHAYEQDFEAQIGIADGEILYGRLSRGARGLVKQWTEINRDALMTNWQAARTGSRKPLARIPGLGPPR